MAKMHPFVSPYRPLRTGPVPFDRAGGSTKKKKTLVR